MKIRLKIILLILVAITSIGIIGILSVSQFHQINDSLRNDLPNGISAIEKTSELNGLAQLMKYYDEVTTQSARNYAFTQDTKWEDRYKQTMPELNDVISKAISEGDDQDKILFSEINKANLASQVLEIQSLNLTNQGRSADAIKILEGKKYADLENTFAQGLKDYATRHGAAYNQALVADTQNINAVTTKMQNLVDDSTKFLFISILAAIIMAIVLGFLFSNNVTKSIKKLISASNEISKGNFDARIDIKGEDEISNLQKAFNMMTASLQKSTRIISQTEQKYRNLYDKSPSLLRSITTEGILTDCNEAYAKTLGYTKQEAIGMSIFDHTAERSISVLKNNLENWKNTKEVSYVEIWMKRKDETIFPTLMSGATLYGELGQVIGRTVAFTDMTEIYNARKKLEEDEARLREQFGQLQSAHGLLAITEKKYKNLYEDSPVLMRTINIDGKILNCNRSYAKSLGYTKEEVIGKSIFEHTSDETIEAMKESFEQWKNSGQVSNKEIWLKRKDGSTLPILLSANNLVDENGKLIGSNTVIRDIYEIYQARKDLEEKETRLQLQYDELRDAHELLGLTEQKYRNLYEKTPVLLRTITTEGILTDCNEAYAKALGYTKQEALGMSIFDHTAERSIKEMRDNLDNWKYTHEVSHKEIWMKRKDGTIFPSLLSGGTLYDENGNVIGRTVALTDLTEIYEARKKIEESEQQVKEHLSKLQKLNSLKDDFLTMITHELKTPLVPIRGYSDILMSEMIGPINEEQKKRLEIIRSSTTSLLKLISDLLDAQKIELGQLKLNKDIHDLGDIIRNSVNKMKPDADKIGITITTDIQEPVPFLCDSSRLEQVISNLVSNSLDFCPKQNGKIIIKLNSEKGHARIIVKDNGIGIVKESINKIFVKFYQVDTSLTREHGGTGIGLAVCKGIVEGHGGKIWAESEGKGKGTEMHILLPLVK